MPSDSLVLLLTQILAGASLLIMIYQVIASQRSRKRADSLLDQLEIGRREYRLMQYRATSNQALMEISSLFIGCNQDNIDEAVSNCLDIVGDFFEVDRASVYLIDYDSNSFSCINEWCRAGVSEQFEAQQSLRLESYPWLRKKLSDRQPVIINSLDCVPRSSTKLSAALRSAATQSLLMVPLISRDTVLGALRIETTYKARDWNDVEIEGVNMVAEILASELSHLQAEQAIRDNQRNFQNMLAYAPVAMVVINNKGVIQYAEGRALARAGFIASQLVGQHVDMAFKNDEVSNNFKQALAGDDCHSKIEIGKRHLEGHFTPVTGFNKEPSSVIITAIDTSDRAKLEERLAKEKLYNNVTGLPNKILLLEKLLSSKELVANEICTSSYLLIISVNRTAPLHSALGTGAMHEMLRQISDRLVEFSGGDNLIAHISEYDFAFLADDISSDESALNIARDIQSLFEQPLFLESTQLNITCSIGIAQCDIRQENADEWVREAQTACVAASKDGGNTERVFHQNLASEALSSWQLSEQLKQALADDKIEPWLQPIVNMETRSPIGFEALARWEISPGQFIPPGEFIPVAEEYGLIEELGNLMLRKSCKLLRRCHSADPKFSDLYI
ncbi:MAG: EAL domain-containing protein, partial [Planctomycetota bacterium]|nr:EAL domain-containing protein [Planctomycetota bacterium]